MKVTYVRSQRKSVSNIRNDMHKDHQVKDGLTHPDSAHVSQALKVMERVRSDAVSVMGRVKTTNILFCKLSNS